MKVEMLDGAWANVLDDDDIARLPHRERKRVMKTWNDAPGSDMERGMALTDALIGLSVTEWSFELPLPREDPTVLDGLAGHDYDVLSKHALALQGKLYKDFGISPDPKVSTGNSSG